MLWSSLLLVALIVLAAWLVRSRTLPSAPSDTPTADPLDRVRAILAERYARGELTRDEYRERVEHLA